jgi:hypothetical protein
MTDSPQHDPAPDASPADQREAAPGGVAGADRPNKQPIVLARPLPTRPTPNSPASAPRIILCFVAAVGIHLLALMILKLIVSVTDDLYGTVNLLSGAGLWTVAAYIGSRVLHAVDKESPVRPKMLAGVATLAVPLYGLWILFLESLRPESWAGIGVVALAIAMTLMSALYIPAIILGGLKSRSNRRLPGWPGRGRPTGE